MGLGESEEEESEDKEVYNDYDDDDDANGLRWQRLTTCICIATYLYICRRSLPKIGTKAKVKKRNGIIA